MNKKRGNVVLDMILFFILLFCFAIVAKVGYVVLSSANDAIQDNPRFGSEAKANLSDRATNYPNTWDNLFVMAMVLTMVFVFVASFLIDSHPMFYAISLGLLVFVFIVGGIFANIHNDVTNTDSMLSFSGSFPKTNYIMDHLVEFGLAAAFLTMVGLFGKNAIG